MFNITSKSNNLYNLDTAKKANTLLKEFQFTEFSGNLGNLVEGKKMFQGCNKMTSFTADLHSLVKGKLMFNGCSALSNFQNEGGKNPNLDNLVNGYQMFSGCSSLKHWNCNLPNLVDGYYMFSGCTSLETFVGDMPNLQIIGDYRQGMFYGCKNLTTFISDISSPKLNLWAMPNSKLNPISIYFILKSCSPLVRATTYYLGLGVDIKDADGNALSEEQQLANKNAFAQEVGYETFDALIAAFEAKGKWVNWTFNGSPTSSNTLDMSGSPVPIYAQLEESSEEMAEYCTEDGKKFYNIFWCHQPHDPSEWNYFGSLLEACGYWGIVPKEFVENK